MHYTVGILIFPEVEVLDFCGPLEIFSAVRLNEERRREESSPIRVVLIAETRDAVTTGGGMRVIPEFTLEDHPPLDVLLIPGGMGTRPMQSHKRVLGWIALTAQQVKVVSSVGTGSFLLGASGLLGGHSATTHWMSLDRMRSSYPNVHVRDDVHIVEDGRIFTSAGISACMELALRIVALMYTTEIARNTARYMEYPYPEDNRRRVDTKSLVSKAG